MTVLNVDKSAYRVAFPEVRGQRLWLREYGMVKQDLGIDFILTPRPHLVTQLLQCCTLISDGDVGDVPEASTFWDLTIGKRIQSLVLLTMIGNASTLTIPLICTNQSCEKMMEVEVTYQEISELQDRADRVELIKIQLGDKKISLRKPRGWDQMKWIKQDYSDFPTARREMIRDLSIENIDYELSQEVENLDEALFIKLDDEMKTTDPLPLLSYLIPCPHCDREDVYSVDLEEICLQILHDKQKRLLRTIHCLAGHYHWSEDEILSIPPRRRSDYLDLIEKESTE